MPRYEHDPTQVAAAITVFPKDDYLFKVGRPRAFERQAKAGHQSYGIRVPLVCVSGPMAGKKTTKEFYLHSEGAQQMTKRFQLAMAGKVVNEKSENEWNLENGGKDWSYDTTDGTVGDAWAAYEGLHVGISLDVEMVKNDKDEDIESQVWGSWMPASA